ncbi:protein of unknown function (TRASH domain) [endosymbiont DhMRE of Dentiscutata heterogama]|uniref:hypothetical protein n=1 Tax=endosymbiont DhMRE of Dentiscutata heterogama TaxID=1609546 RepID=UPI000629D98B|nr:hypothetical protein [endosymbiont DhMRE of Dentiscutata heterogama]CFW93004.1 protein of unknown function (TRASH domain) [endosymbiont DhMRE of Dentiscutata heterogama]
MVKIKNKNGFKWINCENLGEVVEEFKKFRNSQNQCGKYEDYFFLQGLRHKVFKVEGGVIPDERISSVEIYQKDGVDLALNLAPLGLKDEDWKPYKQKVEKVLKEIWETGEVKNYQGFNLNWPKLTDQGQYFATFCDQCHKHIENRKLAYFSDLEKDLDFCSEKCHSQFKAREEENNRLKEQLRKEKSHKIIWMVVSLAAVGLIATVGLVLAAQRSKKNKRKS